MIRQQPQEGFAVHTVRCQPASYEEAALMPIIDRMMGGDGLGVGSGDRVLIKPNFLLPAPPRQAVTTHPLVLRAVARLVLDYGGRPQISDSPARGGFERVLRVGGYAEALADLKVVCRPFAASRAVDVGPPFGRIHLARDALECDRVVNLAKLKTHAQMLLTLGVKNLFGTVVGLQKPEWHMRCGIDRAVFAALIVRICEAVAPCFTLVDGIVGLEGQGPGKAGTPRPLGVLLGGRNAHAVDTAVCRLLALPPARLPTHAAAVDLGLFDGRIDLIGRPPAIHDFRFPELGAAAFGPGSLRRLLRRHVLQKPKASERGCRLCGECARYCPARAIAQEDSRLVMDYDACIRCFCCVEICPHGAMQAVEPPLGRLLGRLEAFRQRPSSLQGR
jgi:uncharacterized protein (DUF362 family)/Pyruvate/2-oxoacid:ferredoxin oxidoreductase delta subunit